MLTLTGAGGCGICSGCRAVEKAGEPTGETVGSEAAGGGAVVVTTVGSFCPWAGGCTTVVMVLPALSTVTTCWGWPVAAACFLACSRAFSCLLEQPDTAATKSVVTNSSARSLTQLWRIEPWFDMSDPFLFVGLVRWSPAWTLRLWEWEVNGGPFYLMRAGAVALPGEFSDQIFSRRRGGDYTLRQWTTNASARYAWRCRTRRRR